MHIPDGFLDTKTWLSASVASSAALGYAIRRVRTGLGERSVPLLGVTAAAIFAAQMINFPVIGGTSGHLIGAALAAQLLGPWAAMVVMTTVLSVQALFFQDGGLTALGANILNMAVVAVLVSWGLDRLVRLGSPSRPRLLAGSFIAGWGSVMAAAVATSLELAVSGTVRLGVVLPAMLFWQAFIGVGEGLITAAIQAHLSARRRGYAASEVSDGGLAT